MSVEIRLPPGIRRIVGAQIIALMLAGCGGGDDGPPPPPPIPANAPGPVVLNYSGATQSVVVTDDNAGSLADDGLASVQLLWELSRDFDLRSAPVGEIRQTVNGPQGGTAEIVGRVQSASAGWLQISYRAYREQDTTLDGVEIQEATGASAPFANRTRRTFSSLRIRGSGIDTILDCNVLLEEGGTGPTLERVSGEFHSRDQLTGAQKKLESARIDFSLTLNSARGWTVFGRFFEGSRGAAEFQTVNPVLGESSDPEQFYAGGPFRIRGAGSSTLWISPLNRRSVALEIDSTGVGIPERSVRLNWSTDFAAQIRRTGAGAPSAILGNRRAVVTTPSNLPLDARFSSHADGRFMSFRWRVLQQPPGAAVSIANGDRPVASVTLDLPGDYQFEVIASEGGRTSRDTVIWEVPRNEAPANTSLDVVAFAPPDTRISVGQTLEIDVTPSVGVRAGTVSNSISVVDEQDRLLTVPISGVTGRFVPSAAGIYRVNVAYLNSTVFDEGTDFAWIAVDRDLWFDSPTRIETANASIVDMLFSQSAANRNLVVISSRAFGNPGPFAYELSIYGGSVGSRRFSAPRVLTREAGPHVAAGDVVGGPLPDLVVGGADGIAVFEQTSSGVYAQGVSFSGVSDCASGTVREGSAIGIADINGDGRADVVRTTPCGDRVEAYRGSPGGSLLAASSIAALAGTQKLVAVVDLNSDGRGDLVTLSEADAYEIRYQGTAGSFSAPAPLDIGGLNGTNVVPVLCFGDVDGDSRADVVVQAFQRVGVLAQTSDGSLAAPVFYPTRGLPGECRVADVNRDGRRDVIIRTASHRHSYVLQTADGRLSAELPDPRSGGTASIGTGNTLEVLDLDGDSLLDMIYASGNQIFIQSGLPL